MRILLAMTLLVVVTMHVQSADVPPEVTKQLDELKKEKLEDRVNACMELAKLGSKASAAIPRLFELAETDLVGLTRQCAIFALGEIGDANTAKKLIAISKTYKKNEILCQTIAFHLDQSNKDYQKNLTYHQFDFSGMSRDIIVSSILITQNKVKIEDTLYNSAISGLYSNVFSYYMRHEGGVKLKFNLSHTDDIEEQVTLKLIVLKSPQLLEKLLADLDLPEMKAGNDTQNKEFEMYRDNKAKLSGLLCQYTSILELRTIHIGRAAKQKPTDSDLTDIVARRELGVNHEYWIKLLNGGKPAERNTAMKVMIALAENAEDAKFLPDFSKYEHDKDDAIAALAVRGTKATKSKK